MTIDRAIFLYFIPEDCKPNFFPLQLDRIFFHSVSICNTFIWHFSSSNLTYQFDIHLEVLKIRNPNLKIKHYFKKVRKPFLSLLFLYLFKLFQENIGNIIALLLICITFFFNTNEDFIKPFICVMIEIFSQRILKTYMEKGEYVENETFEISNFYSVFLVFFFFMAQVRISLFRFHWIKILDIFGKHRIFDSENL